MMAQQSPSRGAPVKSLFILLMLLAASPAGAAEVYRWTDQDGQVHYGQRPPPVEGARRMDLPDATADGVAEDAVLKQRRDDQRRLLESFEYERGRKQDGLYREAEQRARALARCRELQRYWRRLGHPGPIYIKREDGEREFLSDQQRDAEKARVRPVYVQACGREP